MNNADVEYQSAANARIHEARQELRRQLLLRGIPEERATHLLREHGSKIEAERKLGGPQLKVQVGYGSLLGQAGVDALAQQILDAERLLAHGPNPAELLAQRLAGAGMPLEDARRKATGRAWREGDGRISVRHAGTVQTRTDEVFLDIVARNLAGEWATEQRRNSPELAAAVAAKSQDPRYSL